MTSTTFFTGSAPRTAPVIAKAQPGARTAAKATPLIASAVAAYPWMTQAMLSRLSPRARRLLRADY